MSRYLLLLLGLAGLACNHQPPAESATTPPAAPAPQSAAPAAFTAPPPDPARVEAQIKAIRRVYQQIQAAPLTLADSVNVEVAGCINEGILRYYQDQGQIVKIVETGWIGDGGWTTEFYFDHGHYVFGLDVMEGGPADGPDERLETRTYVADGRIIRSISTRDGKPDHDTTTVSPTTAARLYYAYTKRNFATAVCGEEQ